MSSCDAVVVGGGPAGASAAHVLAVGGARVLLLEKATIPRYKPCGGGITARARAASPLLESFPMDTTATAVLIPAGKLSGFPPIANPGVAVEVELAVTERASARYQDAALLDFLVIQGGYGWIFGKGDHLSVGLGVFHGKDRHDIRPALQRLLTRYQDLHGGKVLLQHGHLVPLAGGRETRRRGNVLLAGDAAALADPITADGISYALASGRRADATILAALQGTSDSLASYDHYIDHELCHDFRYARIVAQLSYRYPDVVVRLAAEDPTPREMNTAAVSGTTDYRSLVWHMARKTPTLLRALLTHGHTAA